MPEVVKSGSFVFRIWVDSSVAERVPVKYLRAGSSPAQPS